VAGPATYWSKCRFTRQHTCRPHAFTHEKTPPCCHSGVLGF
jgi:hypothetical protein